jgi:membrane-bound lytic murein transglycosylase F
LGKITIFITAILAAGLISCTDGKIHPPETDPSNLSSDLEIIRQRGKLIAITDINSTNYFVYKGEPMGFHYELLNDFADYLGLDLELITENQLDKACDLLQDGKADIIAIGLTVNSARKKKILFTEPILQTRQVLIQRKPRNWRSLTAAALERQLVRNQLDLANKTVFVQENSAYINRLRALSNEIGDTIGIVEVPYNSEELIRFVANGEIEYTISDENVAMVNSTYYPDIDISTPVSFPQNIAWGLKKRESSDLLNELNHWLSTYKETRRYRAMYAKYFRNSRSNYMVKSDYYSLSTGKISRWDDMIKRASREIEWDWRLLASLIYQESRFDPDVESWAGAYGLMQVMPPTGEKFGIDVKSSPASNMRAGILYINWLKTMFENKIPEENERLKFILASYNAGPGHVLDAMKLAEKNGMDPRKWEDNVAVWLLKKSDPVYYKDAVVKNGYFKGTESVNYVTQILERYEHYKNIISGENSIRLTMNTDQDSRDNSLRISN